MRRIINFVSIAGLILVPTALGVVYIQTHSSENVVQAKDAIIKQKTQESFPLNKPQVINFESQEGFKRLTSRQQSDQLRDWLLVTVVAGKGLSAKDINQSVYDLPTVRYDYMSPVANFEYGTTRSVYIGNDTIVALVPKTASQAERMDDLAHIGDRHRKDQGKQPKIIEVYEYEISPDKNTALITRREEINAAKIFSSDYGYYETTIKSQDDLQSFLNQVDDITFAQVNGSSLQVGGRKIHSRKYQGIRVEDVAALWQSDRKIKEHPEDFNYINGSGFSLDPSFDYPGLAKSLDRAKPLLQSFKLDGKPVISDQDIQKAKQGLSRQDIVPYRKLIDKLEKLFKSKESKKAFLEGDIGQKLKQEIDSYVKRQNQEIKAEKQRYQNQIQSKIEGKIKSAKQSGKSPAEIQQMNHAEIIQEEQKFQQFQDNLVKQKDKELQQFVNAKIDQKEQEIINFVDTPKTQGFQAARYDGDLQGTEVGMVLFYTDLLMKIWDFNLQNSTVKTGIEDFNPETKIKISSMYEKELQDLPYARLWLGPDDKGFQVANENKNILFARNTTRIYAKSSNPLRPKDEQQADASSNAFLTWWNDHYEEVARYEPQYERLNQIMKWSLVINWLNQSNQGDLLGFLQGVSVKPDNWWFPDWVQAQGANLKFQHWQKVGFFEKGYKGTKTEALPILASESFQRFGKTRQFSGGVTLGRPSDFKDRIALPNNTEFSKPLIRSNINPKTVKVADGQVEFTTFEGTTYKTKPLNKNLSETIAQAKAETKFRSPDAELKNQVFTRKVAQTADGLEIQTAIGDTEFGSLNVSKTGNGFKVGFASRDMDAGYSLGLRLSRDQRPILEVLKETEGVQVVMASRTQPSDYIVKLSDSKEYLKISELPKAGGSGSGNGNPPPPSPPPPKDTQMFVGDLGDNSRNFRLSWLDKKQLQKEQAAGKYKEVYSNPFPEPEVEARKINYEQEARKIAQDPQPFILLKQKSLKTGIKKVDNLLKAGKDTKALKLIDQLIEVHGPEPNLMLRKAKVEISQGRLRVEQVFPKQGINPSEIKQNFLDEINKQLENNPISVNRVENDTQFLYGQDSPKFNNLDFKVTVEQSIPSGSGARVYKLIPGEVGTTKLHMSGLGDAGASSHASTQFQGTNPANALRNIRPNTNNANRLVEDDQCQNETEQEKKDNSQCHQEPQEKPVYVVITPENS